MPNGRITFAASHDNIAVKCSNSSQHLAHVFTAKFGGEEQEENGREQPSLRTSKERQVCSIAARVDRDTGPSG
jgi:hypothetical protein